MPVAVGTERKQLFAYDRIIKTRAWTSLLIVNPKGDAEVNGLLAFCPRLRIALVWDPEAMFSPAPTERMRREAVLARLQVTSRANPRLQVLSGPPLAAAAFVAQEQVTKGLELFSGAILVQLEQNLPLASQLRCWAVLCSPDGMLIGKRHADLKLRAELTRVSPRWRPWPNGLWLLDVKHVALCDGDKPGRKTWPNFYPPFPHLGRLNRRLGTCSAPGRCGRRWSRTWHHDSGHPVALQHPGGARDASARARVRASNS